MTGHRRVGLLLLAVLVSLACVSLAEAAPAPFEVRLEKRQSSQPGWEIQLRCPSMASRTRPRVAAAFNREVRARMDRYVADFKQFMREERGRVGKPVKWYLHFNFEPPVILGDHVSVVMLGDSYTGGAHGSHPVDTMVFDAKRGRVLMMRDLFRPRSDWLKRVSGICIKELEKRGLEASTVEDGAGPKEKNFERFVLGRDKLTIIFPEYQVGPYVAGAQQVEIPCGRLRDLAAPGTPLAR